MSAREWFERADLLFIERVQRVMAASTSDPMRARGFRELDGREFGEELGLLIIAARDRHAAKHAATVEALCSFGPVVVKVGERVLPGKEAFAYTCDRCRDTHRMLAHDDSGAVWPCTACPRPCEKCRSGIGRIPGAYCEKTPCDCACHRKVPR